MDAPGLDSDGAPGTGLDAAIGGLSEAALQAAGLAYLARFSASTERVRRVLRRRVRRFAAAPEATARAWATIEQLLERWRAAGLLDDDRYGQARAAGMQARGASRRQIAARLATDGLDRDSIEAAVSGIDGEFAAAAALARRRRLGPYCRTEGDRASRERQLALFARAGFDRATAERVLNAPDPETLNRLLTETE